MSDQLQNTSSQVPEGSRRDESFIPQGVRDVGESISNTVSSAAESVKQSVSGFSSQSETGVEGSSSSFLQSNSIIAKFAFLILIIIVFMYIFNLGIMLLDYFLGPSDNPYLINGMMRGDARKTYTEDPKKGGHIPIKRSNNESSGMEFTWATWIYVNDLGETSEYQHVFNKGNKSFVNIDTNQDQAGAKSNGLATVNNAPGLYLKQNETSDSANTLSLHVIMDTSEGNNITNKTVINDIPIKNWVCVVVRLQNTIMDTYINGTVSGRTILEETPIQNYNDVNVGFNKGFDGYVSNLRYYDYALNIFDINKFVSAGPNTTNIDDRLSSRLYSYISSHWYTSKI